jgi:hypothetical protein
MCNWEQIAASIDVHLTIVRESELRLSNKREMRWQERLYNSPNLFMLAFFLLISGERQLT